MLTFSLWRHSLFALSASLLIVLLFAPGQSKAAFDVAAHMQDEFADLDSLSRLDPDYEPPIIPTDFDPRDEAIDKIIFVRIPVDRGEPEVLIRVPKLPPPPPPIDPWPDEEIERLLNETRLPRR